MVDALTNTTLSSYFTNLINSLMAIERQPLQRLTQQRDTLNVQRGVYLDLQSKLNELKQQLQSLLSSSPFFALQAGRSVNVREATLSGSTIVTATAGSAAVVGDYRIEVSRLARAEQWVSADQASVDLPLGKRGVFWLGGNGMASAAVQSDSRVASVFVGAVATGMQELGRGLQVENTAYRLEVRQGDSGFQFRLLAADGSAVAVYDKTRDDGTLTRDWQTFIPGEVFDTHRGLVITFGVQPEVGSTFIDYQAAGVSVSVEESDTLSTIVTKINAALQPEGHEVVASVVGNYLVLTARQSGLAHRMVYQYLPEVGGDWGSTPPPQPGAWDAQDAQFTVNGIAFTRSKNTGLTDVIYGVSLNLAGDAEGQAATLTIAEDYSQARQAVQAFIDKFNAAQAYLNEKMAITKNADNTYTRGVLANDTVFSELRYRLFSLFIQRIDGPGAYRSLAEVGITLDSNLQATLSDAARLEKALREAPQAVQALFDAVLGAMNEELGRFAGSAGYLSQSVSNLERQASDLASDIGRMQIYLADRQNVLTEQYAQIQAQLISLSYAQQTWASIYGSVNRLF
jgi:flagellar hook-associated protein 2